MSTPYDAEWLEYDDAERAPPDFELHGAIACGLCRAIFEEGTGGTLTIEGRGWTPKTIALCPTCLDTLDKRTGRAPRGERARAQQ